MVKKGTMGALALFRKYLAEDDHAAFRAVIASMAAMAGADGFAREKDGSYALDPCGMPFFDKDRVHPLCGVAQKAFLEYTIGKAVQPVQHSGGAGGARLLFDPVAIEAFGAAKLEYETEGELGEPQTVTIEAKTGSRE